MQRNFIEEKNVAKYERIKAAIKWLIGNGVASNQAELGKLIGYSNEAAFSKVINGKVSLPVEFIYKLCRLDKNRNLSETWVSEGWGPMIDKSRSFISEEERESFNKINNDVVEKTIKYFDIDASAGHIEMFDPGNGTTYKQVVIPGFGDCEIALNVWGDSMEPIFNAGEIILCKEWTENFIDYGHVNNDYKMADIYIEIDYSIYDKANRKVLDLLLAKEEIKKID